MKLPAMLLALLALAQLSAAPISAQGPGALGLRQPAPAVSRNLDSRSSLQSDTAHVKPNHWKRGALIGLVAAAVPTAIYLLSTPGCGDLSEPGCTTMSGAVVVSVGALGALVGGLIGSFFPK